MATDPEVLDPETPADLALALRDPRTPATLDQVSVQKNWQDIFDARNTILETARKRAIRITYPSDWNLYRDKAGTVIGYLSDAGCERVRDILGIEIFNVSKPEKVGQPDGSFMYVQSANGRSKFTQQTVEFMEGGRSSTEDFCQGATGTQLELLVRKATRANLDGNIARELMGMKSVPLGEMIDAWQGTDKDWNQCRKARGFGTQAQRQAEHTIAPLPIVDPLRPPREWLPEGGPPAHMAIPPPTCPVCKNPDGTPVALAHRMAKNGRSAFFGCPRYTEHPSRKVIVDAQEWIDKQLVLRKERQAAYDEENKKLDAEIAAREGLT